jgi:hypothetical protein
MCGKVIVLFPEFHYKTTNKDDGVRKGPHRLFIIREKKSWER